ncbi:hypothetical protein BDV33DRAFT_210319 [Aspergillus novoparasiticus]|uniref:Uncharacterized protein n=1 Tax=Aspergillus novoparasiticus TaxID=986946 RepID=A0A5N6E7H1_9EURO|nr:hypothetical protein BDV33DRAFT_210319 [Aspergillus novoparasiticus]
MKTIIIICLGVSTLGAPFRIIESDNIVFKPGSNLARGRTGHPVFLDFASRPLSADYGGAISHRAEITSAKAPGSGINQLLNAACVIYRLLTSLASLAGSGGSGGSVGGGGGSAGGGNLSDGSALGDTPAGDNHGGGDFGGIDDLAGGLNDIDGLSSGFLP